MEREKYLREAPLNEMSSFANRKKDMRDCEVMRLKNHKF